jgi:hypothetical protein
LGASVRLSVWYEGALLDRLIDADHADVVEACVGQLRAHQWPTVQTEVSFNLWGERGSIDFMGAWEAERAVLIGEAKSAWGSIEQTLRTLDAKARLAPNIAFERLGWRPAHVGVVLVFPESGSARRIAARYAATLLSSFPARNLELRSWLRKPNGQIRGLWFLPVERRTVRRKG